MNVADTILARLRERHARDRFVAECKTGASGDGCLRLDAWAMKCSWMNPLTYGYEIKVGRSDFLRDEKWQGYLAYCHEFYFVCPRGLIAPEELPADVGLLWLASTGTRLFTKRRAPTRDVVIPEDLWRYVILLNGKIPRGLVSDLKRVSADAKRLAAVLEENGA